MANPVIHGAVIVTRVSTGEQVRHGTSLESQLDACRAKAKALSLPIIAEYEDAGISGGFLLSRAGMQQALSDIKAGRADTLICFSMSRYSRDREHQEKIKKEIRAAGGQVVFCDMDFTDSAAGNLQFNVSGDFAVYEKENFRERSMLGKRTRAENGLQSARRTPPFGYHIVMKVDVLREEYPADALGKYFIIEERAAVVREIFARYTARTASLLEICHDLNKRGLPPPGSGRCWHPSTLSGIVSNSAYKGEAVYGKDIHRRDEMRRLEINPRTGEPMKAIDSQRPAPQENRTIIPCPAIVTEAEWEKAQEIMKSRSHLGGNPQRLRMLSGRIFCAECGSRMALTSTPRHGYKREGVYYCSAHHRQNQRFMPTAGIHPCSPLGHKRPTVEQSVINAFEQAAQKPHVVRNALKAYRQERPAATDAADARREIATIDRALEDMKAEEARIVSAQIAGIAAGASADAYAEAFAQIAAKRKDFQDRRGVLRQQLNPKNVEAGTGDGTATDIGEILGEIAQVLTSPTVTDVEKRNVVGRVVEQVRCRGAEGPYPGGVDVVFLPGLFDQSFGESCPEGGILIDQPTTIERNVSQPSARMRMTCGTTKATNTHISQKCHTRAQS